MAGKRFRLFRAAKKPGPLDGIGEALQTAFPTPQDADAQMLRLIEMMKQIETGEKK